MPLIPIIVELIAAGGVGLSAWFLKQRNDARVVLMQNGLAADTRPKDKVKEYIVYVSIALIVLAVLRIINNLTQK